MIYTLVDLPSSSRRSSCLTSSRSKHGRYWRSARRFRRLFFPARGSAADFDFEGAAGDDIADHLVRVLDDDRVRSLQGSAVELIGLHKDRLCEYACGRNFEVLNHATLDLPWAPCPAGRVTEILVRVLKRVWQGALRPESRVVKLVLRSAG